MIVCDAIKIDILGGYDPHYFESPDTKITVNLEKCLKCGFLIPSRHIKKYMQIFEDNKFYYSLDYWPSGKKPNYTDNADRHLLTFDILQLPLEIKVEHIRTEDTFLYGSIGGIESRINNGCNISPSGQMHYYTEGLEFIDSSAKKMIDHILYAAKLVE